MRLLLIFSLAKCLIRVISVFEYVIVLEEKRPFKKILPVVLGQALESYDFFLYGLLSFYFAKIFFPPNSEYALAFSFSIFSVAYIARPIGSIFWGHIADKYGRKPVLIGTLSLMAIPAVGMACMPSYESIGVTATILVVICRFLQGIAFGGETPTVMVTLYELAPENKKGFYGGLYGTFNLSGYVVGMFFIIIMHIVISEDNICAYGWRFLFGISLIFVAILGYLRKKIIETSDIKKAAFVPISVALKKDRKVIIQITTYFLGLTIMLYNLLFHNYLILNSPKFGMHSLLIQTVIVFLFMIMMAFFGYLSDKINKIKLLKFTYLLSAILAYPLYCLFLDDNLYLVVFAYFIFSILTSIVCVCFSSSS